MKSLDIYSLILNRVFFPLISKLTRVKIWDEYRRMKTSENLSLEALYEIQQIKLREILTHANNNVPFYKNRFSEFRFHPDSYKYNGTGLPFPPTIKTDIMSNFPEKITAQGYDRKHWQYVASSGTTRQIIGIRDNRKWNINWAATIRDHKLGGDHDIGMKWMEIPPHMCSTLCGNDPKPENLKLFSPDLMSDVSKGKLSNIAQHYYKYFYSKRQKIYRRTTLPPFGNAGTNIPEHELKFYIESIRKYKPYFLEGLPIYFHMLAKYMIEKNMDPPEVKIIRPYGGSMTTKMKDVIRKAFRCEIYDTYGCTELGMVGCECEKHDGIHVFMDLYHVEIFRNGKPAAPGELGRIFLTDLENKAMPWIRYELGDLGKYYTDDHGCGRKSIRLEIEGRIQDTLINSKGELFSSDRVFDFFHSFNEVSNFQLVEKTKGEFELTCVPENNCIIDRNKMSTEFINFFDKNARVKTYIARSIKAEDGGKFRFVKSSSYENI